MARAPADVFLSYARGASAGTADRLHRALADAGVSTFLDRDAIAYGAAFPPALADAMRGARVVVVLLEPSYLSRWVCGLELRLATALFAHDADAAMRHVVLVLPADPALAAAVRVDLDAMPPALRDGNWPTDADLAEVVQLVRARRDAAGESLGTALGRHLGPDDVARLLARPATVPQPLRLGGAPMRTPDGMRGSLRDTFVGRDTDLWRLHHALAPPGRQPGHAALTAALKGVGGVGKTQLAAEYFHRYGARHYTGGLFWVDARRDVAEQHFAILRAFDPATYDDFVRYRERTGAAQTPARLAGELAQRLRAAAHAGPVLLVVDDVPEPPPPAPNEPPPRPLGLDVWCPAPDAVSCLATSRVHVAFSGAGHVERQSVQVLDPAPAVELLTRGVRAAALAPDEWHEIAEWLGRLPLALAVLNAALRDDARLLRPTEALDAARRHASATAQLDRAAGTLRQHSADDTLRGATEAFRLSFDRLPECEQRALRRFACLAPAPIPLALADALGPDCADAAVRYTLLARSFLTPPEPEDEADVPMIGSVHALLADAVRTFSPAPADDVRAVVEALATVFDSDECQNPAAWKGLTASVPHAVAALAITEEQGAHDMSPAGSPSVGLGLNLGILGSVRGDYAAARRYSEATFELATRLHGAEHPITLTSLNNLALTLRGLGDFAGARAMQEQVVPAHQRVLGAEHPDTLRSQGNLAETLRAQGDFVGARPMQEQVLAGQRRVLGAEHPDTLTSLNNLALTLSGLGDLARARAMQEHVLAHHQRVLGSEHPDTVIIQYNLAFTVAKLGELAGARQRLEDVVATSTRTLGAEHPNTKKFSSTLAWVIDLQRGA